MEKRTGAKSKKLKVASDSYSSSLARKKSSTVKDDYKENLSEQNVIHQEIPVEKEKEEKVVKGLLDDQIYIEESKKEALLDHRGMSPPDLEDGEVLRKSKKADSLGLASGIMGYSALGIFLLSLLILFILWIVFYTGAIGWPLVLIIYYFMFFGSMALGVAALITGAISFARNENGMALAGIIIGSIFLAILLLTLLIVLI